MLASNSYYPSARRGQDLAAITPAWFGCRPARFGRNPHFLNRRRAAAMRAPGQLEPSYWAFSPLPQFSIVRARNALSESTLTAAGWPGLPISNTHQTTTFLQTIDEEATSAMGKC